MEKNNGKGKEKSEVPALESSIKIMEYLSRYTSKERSLSQISKKLSINKSTCHRILKLLTHYRYVSYDDDSKQYNLGSYLIILGARAAELIDYLKLAKPHLKWVSDQTGLTSVLLEPVSHDRLMYVAKEEPELPDSPVQVTVKLGQHFPLTSASFGKCYLAFIEEEKMNEIIQTVNFKQFTDKSIIDYETFKDSLKEVQQKGYAVSYEEHTSGVFGIAAPIFNSAGEISMVIACIGFSSGISEEFVTFCGEQLMEAAGNIMKVTGGRKPF
ncbi:IclR family transcriptional regulator [Bacillus benzoevorans]|uniref:DNA-binding IclR family transcriptional regulator n=1 Tax=Bacillus benzoevorans TaxID=1456 RepID=A0A7X0HWB1_9BACI|nr:IclR family transcriptional regulator [Bacillus benzoevorans]MBB6446781.1 DNA-binding IclR family transcriptional regulator [Bacillus benzoevorans]